MKKILIIGLLSLFLFPCDYSYGDSDLFMYEVDSQRGNYQIASNQNDSKAIGDINLGIDKPTFEAKKKAFLKANPSLNGRKIEEMKGDFYRGKLYSITIRSVEIEDASLDPIVQNDKDLKKKWERDSHIWTSLYKEKYKDARNVTINRTDYITIKRGRCTIEVSDKEHRLLSLEELKAINKRASRRESVPLKIFSVIHIYDKSVVDQIKKEKEQKNKQNSKKSLDVI